MYLKGLKGDFTDLMGEYTMQCQKNNGYPVYMMKRPGNEEAVFLHRSNSGNWMVGEKDDMSKNRGWILSYEAAELPSKAGLTWQYCDPAESSDWIPSDKLVCSESEHTKA